MQLFRKRLLQIILFLWTKPLRLSSSAPHHTAMGAARQKARQCIERIVESRTYLASGDSGSLSSRRGRSLQDSQFLLFSPTVSQVCQALPRLSASNKRIERNTRREIYQRRHVVVDSDSERRKLPFGAYWIR